MTIPILLDKSAFQGLSKKEHWTLRIHYYVNYPPVLLVECLADLKKKFPGNKPPEREVAILISKFGASGSDFNVAYRKLGLHELAGRADIPQEKRPIVDNVETIYEPDGGYGLFKDDTKDWILIREWQNGNFSKFDSKLAEFWRLATRKFDLKGVTEKTSWLDRQLPKTPDLGDIADEIENLIEGGYNGKILNILIDDLQISKADQNKIIRRWTGQGYPSLKSFSPYCSYVAKVLLTFFVGVRRKIIPEVKTHRIDVEYAFYLPFCRVFSSSDNFQADFCKVFLTDGHAFVGGNELKSELRLIQSHLENLTREEQVAYNRKYGMYPPELPNSITLELWKRFVGDRSESFGNQVEDLSEEEIRKIEEEFKQRKSLVEQKIGRRIG